MTRQAIITIDYAAEFCSLLINTLSTTHKVTLQK